VWALGLFDDHYRAAIHAFKFHHRLDAGEFLGSRLAAMVAGDPRSRHIQIVVPVPLHPTRLRERGFNQSEMLARLVGAALNVPVEPRMLRRTRNTPTQTALDYESRRKNVAGAFRVGDAPIDGQNVLLVDDVSTTGATISECADALHEAGAGDIFGAVVALAALGV
jgi:ComF family protein